MVIKPRIVEIDNTDAYQLAPDEAEVTKKIIEVYIYDMNEYTFCCEVTPSRWLVPIEIYAVPKEGVDIDQLDELLQLPPLEEGIYCHAHRADKLPGRTLASRRIKKSDYDKVFAEICEEAR